MAADDGEQVLRFGRIVIRKALEGVMRDQDEIARERLREGFGDFLRRGRIRQIVNENFASGSAALEGISIDAANDYAATIAHLGQCDFVERRGFEGQRIAIGAVFDRILVKAVAGNIAQAGIDRESVSGIRLEIREVEREFVLIRTELKSGTQIAWHHCENRWRFLQHGSIDRFVEFQNDWRSGFEACRFACRNRRDDARAGVVMRVSSGNRIRFEHWRAANNDRIKSFA